MSMDLDALAVSVVSIATDKNDQGQISVGFNDAFLKQRTPVQLCALMEKTRMAIARRFPQECSADQVQAEMASSGWL